MTTSRYYTSIETTQTTRVRVEKGMVLTELGGWVLIDKDENENGRITMAIMKEWTIEDNLKQGYLNRAEATRHDEMLDGQKYADTATPPRYTNWNGRDRLPLEEDKEKAMNTDRHQWSSNNTTH
jgi:hypothetical protein